MFKFKKLSPSVSFILWYCIILDIIAPLSHFIIISVVEQEAGARPFWKDPEPIKNISGAEAGAGKVISGSQSQSRSQ